MSSTFIMLLLKSISRMHARLTHILYCISAVFRRCLATVLVLCLSFNFFSLKYTKQYEINYHRVCTVFHFPGSVMSVFQIISFKIFKYTNFYWFKNISRNLLKEIDYIYIYIFSLLTAAYFKIFTSFHCFFFFLLSRIY